MPFHTCSTAFSMSTSPLPATLARRGGIRQCLALALALLLGLTPPGAATACTDLSLVLAIDASSSIDGAEFALQSAGYAAALADSEVHRALRDAGEVDLAVLFWADAAQPVQVIPWHRVRKAADAVALAALILGAPRQIDGETDIGSGLDAALDLLADRCTVRALVNISGDGMASLAVTPWLQNVIPVRDARARAEAMGVTVNGLAILTDVPDLDRYYRDQVATGAGSFVMAVADFSTFADAIRRKLVREIAPPLTATLPATQRRRAAAG